VFRGVLTCGWSCLKAQLTWRQYLAAEAMKNLGWSNNEIETSFNVFGLLI